MKLALFTLEIIGCTAFLAAMIFGLPLLSLLEVTP